MFLIIVIAMSLVSGGLTTKALSHKSTILVIQDKIEDYNKRDGYLMHNQHCETKPNVKDCIEQELKEALLTKYDVCVISSTIKSENLRDVRVHHCWWAE